MIWHHFTEYSNLRKYL